MSCGPVESVQRPLPDTLQGMLADEGFRLFFPLGAAYAALFPLLWVLAFSFDLPLAASVPASLWHGHEMLVGAFGAALIGFLTTAAPEWTDTEPPRGRTLWVLAALWGTGRLVGVLGWDGLGLIGAICDLAWLVALVVFLIRLTMRRRTDRLITFVFWVTVLAACVAATRWGFWRENIELATKALHLTGLAFLALLGLALSRITTPVTNQILDPTERSSPFRPHPGRLHLAPGLVLIAIVAEIAPVSANVSAFVLIAAGAAFMDRVGEAFVGREAMRAEILLLAGSSGLAGLGLLLAGAARLGGFWMEVTGLHVTYMGGLGLGVYAVYCIAGLLHSGRDLGLSLQTRFGALMILGSVALRVAPDFDIAIPGPLHGGPAVLWAAGFLLWVWDYWPAVSKPALDADANDGMT